MKPKKPGRELLKKLRKGTISPGEQQQLESWYDDYARSAAPFDDLQVYQQDMRKLDEAFPFAERRTDKIARLWTILSGVAAALLFTAAAALFYFKQSEKPSGQAFANDIKPGGNKAYLTLSNGEKIVLTDAKNGEVARQAGITITKTADGQLLYVVSDASPADAKLSNAYNTIETPKGGQYQLSLPDGSKVWLNAASSLTYPVSFANLKTRKVSLKGEAYFEVAKDKFHPFTVTTDQQELEVLGTHFNLNAYETSTKTTLLEGMVKVSGTKDSRILNPGQQSSLMPSGKLSITPADTELVMAWKNNLFMFESEKIENIMKMLERWYDVEVVYESELTNDRFGGAVSKFDNISKVLKILESTKSVHFKIEGRRITVMK